MEKIYNIKGYWKNHSAEGYNEKDMWEGHFLLDGNYFEGIVVEPNSSYNEDRFIFGTFDENIGLSLNKFTPINISTPFLFNADALEENSYDGAFFSIDDIFGELCEVHLGSTRIYIQNVENTSQNINKEIAFLKYSIERWKKQIMDDFSSAYYQEYLAQKQTQEKDKQLEFEPVNLYDYADDLPF